MLELYDFRILINFLFPSIDVDNNEIEKIENALFFMSVMSLQWTVNDVHFEKKQRKKKILFENIYSSHAQRILII